MEFDASGKSTALMRVEDLGYENDGKTILKDISFDLMSHEHLAVVGSSGSGKSTLLRLLNRLLEPTHGKVYLEGQDYTGIPPRELRRRVGLILQQPYLFPGTVADNLRFGPTQRGENIAEEAIDELLANVDLPGFAQRDVANLSGGEAQRVSIARTLANMPEVLLMDEPTSALDEESRLQVEKLVCSIAHQEQLTFIIVTHDPAQAGRLAEKALVLEDGRVEQYGKVEEIIHVK
ncbi:MAG: UDP-glucose/iron transport system ATP-binding protein [Chloroflexota bacterium]|nr:UDP-glucose/iron transport system ATP-binding protein [Chloroflexota bacterium]